MRGWRPTGYRRQRQRAHRARRRVDDQQAADEHARAPSSSICAIAACLSLLPASAKITSVKALSAGDIDTCCMARLGAPGGIAWPAGRRQR